MSSYLRLMIICNLLLYFAGHAQDFTKLKSEGPFLDHLYKHHQFNDAIYLLKSLQKKSNSSLLTDTLNYLIGKSYYWNNEPDSSMRYLQKLSGELQKQASPNFFKFMLQTRRNNFDDAANCLASIESNTMNQLEQIKFGHLSLSLLENDIDGYMDISTASQFILYKNEVAHFTVLAQQWGEQSRKKPWMAGTLSAILPGAGKFYAGKKGEALSDFLITASLAGFAYESYQQKGSDNLKTILFSSAFAIFHVGNIWGSIFAVKRKKHEAKHEMDQEIYHHLDTVLDITGN